MWAWVGEKRRSWTGLDWLSRPRRASSPRPCANHYGAYVRHRRWSFVDVYERRTDADVAHADAISTLGRATRAKTRFALYSLHPARRAAKRRRDAPSLLRMSFRGSLAPAPASSHSLTMTLHVTSSSRHYEEGVYMKRVSSSRLLRVLGE